MTGDGIVFSSAILPDVMPSVAISYGNASLDASFKEPAAEVSSFERRRATLAHGKDAGREQAEPKAAATSFARRGSACLETSPAAVSCPSGPLGCPPPSRRHPSPPVTPVPLPFHTSPLSHPTPTPRTFPPLSACHAPGGGALYHRDAARRQRIYG